MRVLRLEKSLNEQYRELCTKALNHAILFNKIIDGKSAEDMSDDELISKIHLQADVVVREEFLEWQENFGINLVEEIDACCDVLVTAPYLQYLIEEAKKRDSIGAYVNFRMVGLVIRLASFTLSNLPVSYYDGVESYCLISEALDRIIENNMSKVTTDVDYFETWVAPKGETLFPKSTVVDGVRYYLLVNESGKCRKPEHFVGVDLEDLAEELTEQYMNMEIKDEKED